MHLTPNGWAIVTGLGVVLGVLSDWVLSLEAKEADEIAGAVRYGPPEQEV